MKKITLVFIILLCLPSINSAQDGSLDTSFGNQGIVFSNFGDANNRLSGAIELSEGKIMVVVNAENPGEPETNFLLRYLEDGTLDESFANSGVFQPSEEGVIRAIAALSNDGFITSYSEENQNNLVKYFSDTSIDLDFGQQGILVPLNAGQSFRSFRVNEDDSILVYAQETIDDVVHLIIKRFLPSGSIDAAFGTNGILRYPIAQEDRVNYFTFTTAINNKVLITYKEVANNNSQVYVARFMENGSLDLGFGNNGVATIPIEEEFNCFSLEFADKKLLIGCGYYDQDEETTIKKTIKLNSTGILDPDFGNEGYLEDVSPVLIQPNQKFIGDNSYDNFEGGSMVNYKRYESNGFINSNFTTLTGPFEVDSPSLYLLNSGKFLVATHQIWYDANPFTNLILMRYNNNPLSIEENTLQTFTIYPNPSNGIFNLNSTLFSESISYQITDVSGKIIQIGKLTEANSQINLSNAQSGLYFLKAGNASYKLIKQ